MGGEAAWASLGLYPDPARLQLVGGTLPHFQPCGSLSHRLGVTGNHFRERFRSEGVFTPFSVLQESVSYSVSSDSLRSHGL